MPKKTAAAATTAPAPAAAALACGNAACGKTLKFDKQHTLSTSRVSYTNSRALLNQSRIGQV